LDERESHDLAAFCRRLDRYHTPVIAILDFPRRDRVQRALECGAAAVLGKPWRAEDLLGTIEQNLRSGAQVDGHANNRAA
jgi:AmiR/NasT family two-component response regulator